MPGDRDSVNNSARLPPGPMKQNGRFYSIFDIGALVSIHTVKNAILVSLTPVAVSLVRELRGTTTGGIALSSLPIAVTMFGSFVSSVGFYFCIPAHVHESRAPFFALAATLILGEIIYCLLLLVLPHEATSVNSIADVERVEIGLFVACLGRIVMSLGDGCMYSSKRMITKIPDASARRDAFFLIAISGNLGIFGGPLLVGANLFFHAGHVGAPLMLGFALSLGLIFIISYLPMDVKWPADSEDSATDDDNQAVASAAAGLLSAEEKALVRAAEGETVEERPSSGVSMAVQATCFIFNIFRRIVRYAYESATVVIFTEHFGITEAGAAMLVGVLGLALLLPILGSYWLLVFRFKWDLEGNSYMMALLTTAVGILASVLIIYAANDNEEVGIGFMMLSALPMYSFTIFSTVIGNAHTLQFAIDDNRLFNREALVAQSEILQSPIATTIGLILGRSILGDAVHVRFLGRHFLLGMLLLLALVAIGWDPRIWMRILARDPSWGVEHKRA
jgi:hypothetical protein